tara:strand:+ start:389 stop:1459 length:1071 start_codon:yes stop_codon:yes gene_type:complete
MTSLSDDAYVGTLHYKFLDPPVSAVGGEDLQDTCDNGFVTTTAIICGNLNTSGVGGITASQGEIVASIGNVLAGGKIEGSAVNATTALGFTNTGSGGLTNTGSGGVDCQGSGDIQNNTGFIKTLQGNIECDNGDIIAGLGKIVSNRTLTEAITTLTDIKIGQNTLGDSASFSGKVNIFDQCKVVGAIVQTGAANDITTEGDINLLAGNITATAGDLNLTAGNINAFASGGGTGGTIAYARRTIDNIRQFINSSGTGNIVDTVNMNAKDYLTWNINATGGTVSSAELTITKTDYLGGASLIGNAILLTDAQGTGSTGITVSKQVYGGTGTTTVWKLNFSPSIPSGQSITGSFEIITI